MTVSLRMYNTDFIVAHGLKCSNCVYFVVIIIIIIIIIYDNVQHNLKEFVIKIAGLGELPNYIFILKSQRQNRSRM
jgi:hypothetical protein